MNNDRTLAIYTARDRTTKVLQAAPMSVQELFQRLGSSRAIQYTSGAYKALKKSQQDSLKDVGAYIAGELRDGRRRGNCVLTRSAAVLDADNLPGGSTDDFLRRVAALGCCYCVHSTAKHTPGTPRLRVVIPFAQDIPAEQYAPVARMLCQLIQPEMTWFDPTCAEAGRIMYYPSHCQDVTPVYVWEDKPFLEAAALLARLQHWQDMTFWPAFPRETKLVKAAARQQGDPEAKNGVVGAFCRVYDIPAAMNKFLPGMYEETSTPGRCTFLGGSTTGGAVIYDNGKFLYSHHATDPCSGRLVNAFDLVRLHLFSERDESEDVKDKAKGNRLPSYQAMCELAAKDEAVAELLARETADEFKNVLNEDAAQALARCTGEVINKDILSTALQALGVSARRNMITDNIDISGMPEKYSVEYASTTLPVLVMDLLTSAKIKGVTKPKILDYLAAEADENRYNPVLDMFQSTVWDGVHRFPRLLQILHIDAESFYALLLRKWLIQGVAMAHNTYGHIEPADGVLVIQGAQGAGKTTLLRKLAVKTEWFSEGVTLDMRNKDDITRSVSVWITELGELEDTLKKEQKELKAFITQRVDKIRAPYAAKATEKPRRTSFGATVNSAQFLKDDTGNRRFWVVPVEELDINSLLALPEEWFIQLWAEVYVWWQQNPRGFRLSPTEQIHLEELNRNHGEALVFEEEIRQALDFNLPRGKWQEVSASKLGKLLFLSSYKPGDAAKIGRVLAKLTRDECITRRVLHGVSLYRLPMLIQTYNTIL